MVTYREIATKPHRVLAATLFQPASDGLLKYQPDMSKPDYPITAAIRFLRAHKIDYTPRLYPYVEHGGTAHSAASLGVGEHEVIKTIVLQNEARQGLIVLMHGDKQISTRNLARTLGMKHIEPADPKQAYLYNMVTDGIAILKVGPALTYGLREALFSLSMMEKELVPEEKRANFIE